MADCNQTASGSCSEAEGPKQGRLAKPHMQRAQARWHREQPPMRRVNLTNSSGAASHTEGYSTLTQGAASHAEGNQTQALGQNSHAEGVNTIASGSFSHTEEQSTDANLLEGVHVLGKFGAANELSYSWYLANGTDAPTPGLAAKILRNGNVKIDGTVSTPAADYAEMFETFDGNPIDFGFFVTLDEDKVRIANGQDGYILGITSANPAFLADSGELRWKHKYLTTEWGEVLYEEIVVPPILDMVGSVIIPQRTESRPVLNPEWDASLPYLPRSLRSEWIAIGLLGKLLVRDNGLCKSNGWCRPNDQGIAVPSDSGYRV